MISRTLLCLVLAVSSTHVVANVDIATCTGLSGQSFFHGGGLVPKKSQGWAKDGIKEGRTTFKRLKDGKYDILMIDAMQTLYSLRQDGGEVILLRKGSTDATFLHVHPGMVIEIYTLWKDIDGVGRFDLLSSKGGDGMSIHKSSVMTGLCNEIDFNVIN